MCSPALPTRKKMRSSEATMDAVAEKDKGNQFFKSGDYQKAMECYSKAIEIDPTNPVLYGNRAQTYLNLKKPEKAEIDCDKAISIDPKFVKGYYRRGLARKSLNKLQLALEDFQKALNLDSKNIQSENELKTLKSILATGSSPFSRKSKGALQKINQDLPKMDYFPTRLPSNSFEFYQDWREMGDQSENKYNYLKLIGGQGLRDIFMSSLEPMVWSEIINILDKEDTAAFSLDVLYSLNFIGNFSTLVLFLDKDERRVMQRIIERIQNDPNLDKNRVDLVARTIQP